MSSDYDRNIQYACKMCESLKEANIPPERTELILLGTDEMKGMIFQANENQYGYGNVISFDEYEMSARFLLTEYPLCNAIKFDDNGRAAENVEVLIVGIGRMGLEVLRKVITNGQFEGSEFHATIYDPKHEQRTGFAYSQYPMMFKNYKISFEPKEGRGNHIFNFLEDNAQKLKYIVVCLNDRETSRDIAIHMVDRLATMGCSLNVYTCDPKSVRCYSSDMRECKTHWIYDSKLTKLICSGEIDRYAVELNHRYAELSREHKGIAAAADDWKKCDYFGRMSSRASVDCLIPLIRRVSGDSWVLTSEQRENVSRSEHLRWCAFHYTFGFSPMGMEEFIQRIRDSQAEIKAHGKSSIKLTKDMKKKTHVCLVEWDELDEISETENSMTGSRKDYKENDRQNVDMVTGLMKSEEK